MKTFEAAKVGGVKNYFVEQNMDLTKEERSISKDPQGLAVELRGRRRFVPGGAGAPRPAPWIGTVDAGTPRDACVCVVARAAAQ